MKSNEVKKKYFMMVFLYVEIVCYDSGLGEMAIFLVLKFNRIPNVKGTSYLID